MKENENKVYILKSYDEHDDSEVLGMYGTQRATVAGLAGVIYRDHVALRDAKPEEIAKIVALAVFDFVSLFGFKSDRTECRDGHIVYGCRMHTVQFLDDEKEKEKEKGGDNA